MFEHLLSLGIESIFINNILLAYFLGMCSFLACSKNIKTAIGLGFAVIFVLSITAPMNWLINEFLLKEGALAWAGFPTVDLSFLQFISFIATIAAMVQIVELVMEQFAPALYSALGIFLPLIAVNCSILGASLFMVERNYNFSETVVFGFGSGIGWLLAIVAMAAVQQKMSYANFPKGLAGFGVNMIITGLISMTFMAFAGIKLVG
ncbi:NADH:ubiquinone reductase (Na(+)-transporting) subunit E [bacterium]|jgi:Na+-transporting NADH:ubiquinone oxidoreductase subunit E|nr:NADH:ubiquinone reductase (Na(+)-transporting) subunit E [bacterium]